MCQVDLLFLESQLNAIKEIATKGMNEACVVALYSDGSLMVETDSFQVPFDDVQIMIDTIQEHRRD